MRQRIITLLCFMLFWGLVLMSRTAGADTVKSGHTETVASGGAVEVEYHARVTGVLKVKTKNLAGTVLLKSQSGKVLSAVIPVSMEKEEKMCFGITKGKQYRVVLRNTGSETAVVKLTEKKRKVSAAKSFKKAPKINYFQVKTGTFSDKQKKSYWFRVKTEGREYLQAALLGECSGTFRIGFYTKKRKKIAEKTITLQKEEDSGLILVKKKRKGTFYIKVSPGKGATGQFIVRNRLAKLKTGLNKAMIKPVNKLRKENGVMEVFWDKTLEKGCLIRAEELITKFSHTRPNGTSYSTAYVTGTKGENIATAYETKDAYGWWLQSPGHKRLMITAGTQGRRAVKKIGFACARSEGGSVMAMRIYYEE